LTDFQDTRSLSDRPEQPLTPAAFSPQPEVAAETQQNTPRPPWLIPAIAGLIVVAIAVFVILPRLVGDPRADAYNPTTSSNETGSPAALSTGNNVSGGPSSDRSPFAEAQRQQLRKAAQDALQRVLELQEILRDLGVEVWAPDTYQAAVDAALAGDEAYRRGDFTAAATAYLDAGDALVALEDSVPTRIAAARAEILAAVEAGKQAEAQTALERLVLLSPGDLDRDVLSDRVAAIPTVNEALAAASLAAESNKLADAIAAAQTALAADSAHKRAAQALKDYQQQQADQRFQQAMTAGYDALDRENFSDADAAFRRAGTLRPSSAEVQVALAELADAKTAATLRRLAREGADKEASEDWQGALALYQQALTTDSTLVFAQEGIARTQPRAELATALTTILSEQERLVDARILVEAEATLQQAKAIADAGPMLTQQIDEVATALEYARTPVQVTLTSDGLTDVTLLRVKRLGPLAAQTLTLRPGDYVALGVRTGFRDVRVSFRVKPGEAAQVDVRCTEGI
jgi:hypothetical protein